jgi:uncharacterized protein YecE (DUF72 family)
VSGLWIGCSGWSYKHWRDVVYPSHVPERSWLEHYATLLGTVEVNATFYRLQKPETVRGWAERTPPGFVFAVKASRYLTHVERLSDRGRGVDRFVASVAPLAEAGKLGPILWQLPETFRRDDERLRGALARLPSGRHAFEFRHESWFVPEVEELLRAHGVALAVGDHPERPFQALTLTTDWTYVRFHVGRGKDGRYTGRQLLDWSERIRDWQHQADVYAYFNNDWQGFAVANARQLAELLR